MLKIDINFFFPLIHSGVLHSLRVWVVSQQFAELCQEQLPVWHSLLSKD